jgi:hypothetical protein
VDADWLARHARRDALARRLRDWLQNRQGKQLLVTPILDELRRSGRYEQVAKAAATFARLRAAINPALGWSEEPGDEGHPERAEARIRALLHDHIHATAWRPDVPPVQFAEEAGFADVRDLLDELVIAREIRARAKEQLQLLEALFEPDDESR